jgi:hypothetical protein
MIKSSLAFHQTSCQQLCNLNLLFKRLYTMLTENDAGKVPGTIIAGLSNRKLLL